MKTKHFFVVAYILCALCIIGCNRQPFTNPYSDYVTVIKLDKPEYKQYVLAFQSGYAGKADLSGSGNIFDDGTLPYWDLADDYLLIDWRWYMFPRYETTYLIFEPWTEQNTYAFGDGWSLDTCQYIKNPIKRRYNIDMARVNEYLGTAELYQMDYSETHGEHSEGTDRFYEFRAKTAHMDSVWAYTQDQLNTIIEQGELKKMIIKDLFKN